MKALLAVPFLVVLALPCVWASQHMAAPMDVRAVAGNQRIDVTWSPVAEAAGYTVRFYAKGELTAEFNVTSTQTTYTGRNGVAYAILVAARDPGGTVGPWSAPAAATPGLAGDGTYLAAGLILTWVGLWGYALFLSRLESKGLQEMARLRAATEKRGGTS